MFNIVSHRPPLQWRSIEGNEVRFAGIGRGDELHEAFAILVEGEEYFGEFQLKYHADRMTYGVEILSFGYTDIRNLGNRSPTARRAFATAQAELFERLVVGLFDSEGSRPSPVENIHNFDHTVAFAPGWLRLL